MRYEEVRFVWVVVMFDIPVKSKPQRKKAARFRKDLIDDGFLMIQFSVYARPCRGQEAATKHIKRVRLVLPEEGSIRCLQITDKQFEKMELMRGLAKKSEEIGGKQLAFL